MLSSKITCDICKKTMHDSKINYNKDIEKPFGYGVIYDTAIGSSWATFKIIESGYEIIKAKAHICLRCMNGLIEVFEEDSKSNSKSI